MRFKKEDKWAVDQALREMYAAGVPSTDYENAVRSIRTYANGITHVSELTVGGSQIAIDACEILEAKHGVEYWKE